MAMTFERNLNGVETLIILLHYQAQARYLEDLPINTSDTYCDILMKISDLDKQGYDWEKTPVRFVRDISEKYAIRLIREFPRAFAYIKNPTKAVCDAYSLTVSAGKRM